MLGLGAVGKVEPGHVHAGRQEPGQKVPVTGRAQGAHNLGASLVTQHGRVTSSFLEKRAWILCGKKFHTVWKKNHNPSYRIARNYNSKKNGWSRVDNLF
jgi:hypothetical protein